MIELKIGDKVDVTMSHIQDAKGFGSVKHVSNQSVTVEYKGGAIGCYPLSDVKKHEPSGEPYQGMASQSNKGNM